MSLIGKLFSVEWIKLRRRPVLYVVVLGVAAVVIPGLVLMQVMHHRRPAVAGFSLPDGWPLLVDAGGSIGMVMILVSIALLTASEATWRTQRQNVIDGLSRAQYFTAKIIVVVMMSLAIWATLAVLGILIAALGGAGGINLPFMTVSSAAAFGNLLFYLLALGITGFMFGMLTSSSGAALGLIMAFIIIQPVIGAQLRSQDGLLHRLPSFFPMDVMSNLVSRMYYDADAMTRMRAMLEKAGEPPPLSLSTSMIATLAYMAAFVGVTWLVFRTRDL
jgi:ABC-type transport system involved in multi-copper enzyme maturation permease subunit